MAQICTQASSVISTVLVLTNFTIIFVIHIGHMSVQSQLQIKNVPGIWHMPNYSLIFWVPKTGKNKKFQRWVFFLDRSKDFPL